MQTYSLVVSALGHLELPVTTLCFKGDDFFTFDGLLNHVDTIACRTTKTVKPLAKTTTTTNTLTG